MTSHTPRSGFGLFTALVIGLVLFATACTDPKVEAERLARERADSLEQARLDSITAAEEAEAAFLDSMRNRFPRIRYRKFVVSSRSDLDR